MSESSAAQGHDDDGLTRIETTPLLGDRRFPPPLVPEHVHPIVKVLLLPVTLPLAVLLMLAYAVYCIAEALWQVLRGE